MTDEVFFPRAAAMALADLAELTGTKIASGDPALSISGIGPIDQSHPGEITFIDNPRYIKQLPTTKASAIFASPRVARRIPGTLAILEAADAYRAYAIAARHFYG